MKSLRKFLAVLLGTAAVTILGAASAVAQTPINVSTTPEKNISPTGPLGSLPSIAQLLGLLGLVAVVMTVILYMRYAPRFASEEGSSKVVRADRVRLGQELPHRNVDLSQASPVIVAPPAIPAAVGAPAPAPAVAAAPAAVPTPAAESPPPAAAAAPRAPAAAPTERVEVSIDQSVYDKTLEELLAAGTDRRIAEGKAKRAGMIAAKRAAGEG
jgi:hypothetical protein